MKKGIYFNLLMNWIGAGLLSFFIIVGFLLKPMIYDFMDFKLNFIEFWLLLGVFSLMFCLPPILHLQAHLLLSRLCRQPLQKKPPLFPLGEAAQFWPPAPTPALEIFLALVGPLANLFLAFLGYGLWELQLGSVANKIGVIFCIENLVIAAMNLAPVFPFDGGRLSRLILSDLLGDPSRAARWVLRLGLVLFSVVAGWGVFLLFHDGRIARETGAGIFIIAMLLMGLTVPMENQDSPENTVFYRSRGRQPLRRWLAGGLAIFILLLPSALLLPLPGALMAPQPCIQAEKMLVLPPEKCAGAGGRFLITSVITQVPIVLGQWLYGHLDHSVRIVPVEEVVPTGMTPQGEMKQAARDLVESCLYARVVALRLAGYSVPVRGEGVEVLSVLAQSPSRGKLRTGDVIVSFMGNPVWTAPELTQLIRRQAPGGKAEVVVLRERRKKTFELSFMSLEDALPTRLGIIIETYGLKADFPFTVEVRPYKMIGGPSAGLMLTLALYSRLTPGDLSGGHLIAGTGAVDLEGNVQEIGAVECKVAAAERAGAAFFLCPAENSGAARKAARNINVVAVRSIREAVDFLRRLTPLNKQDKGV
ncbi:MAG: PDZ domain-containing protein [bacterium]